MKSHTPGNKASKNWHKVWVTLYRRTPLKGNRWQKRPRQKRWA